jgi:hypothetical protein
MLAMHQKNAADGCMLQGMLMPAPAIAQFAVGSLLALGMWALRLHARPAVDRELLLSVLPLAAVHTLGNLLTNVSLGQVAVSFTHTIKARAAPSPTKGHGAPCWQCTSAEDARLLRLLG